jgi:hypothetical protein
MNGRIINRYLTQFYSLKNACWENDIEEEKPCPFNTCRLMLLWLFRLCCASISKTFLLFWDYFTLFSVHFWLNNWGFPFPGWSLAQYMYINTQKNGLKLSEKKSQIHSGQISVSGFLGSLMRSNLNEWEGVRARENSMTPRTVFVSFFEYPRVAQLIPIFPLNLCVYMARTIPFLFRQNHQNVFQKLFLGVKRFLRNFNRK